MKEKVDHYT